MARTITDEEIKLSIIINGNPAQKQLLDLEKATKSLTNENKALNIERRKLAEQGKKESDEYKKLTATIRENTKAIDNNKATMKELQNQIGITGLTMSQLQQKATMLKFALRDMVPGSENYKQYHAELLQVNNRISELNGRSQQAGFSLGNIADKFNRYAALGASVLGFFAGMVVSVQKIIDINGKLSDAQSNVMKTTGMTKKEVDNLTKSFGALQTRTSRIDLLGIAEVGGRLGIAKQDIGSFVQVMDKASVALGDSFEGGPEVVADKLGKIKGLYDELEKSSVKTAFESVGSALNDLGAAGTASEQNVSEFVTRVGSLPPALKPTIEQALGLGAAFEESGLKAEIAGTNYGKVISIASRDFTKFAQVMGLPVEKVKEMINTNPTEFFLQFSNSLKNLDATELSKILDYLKLNDNEVKMVLGAAAKNTDLFREKINLASNSLIDASSMTNEFNVKNENLAATLEKIRKKVSGWFSSESFVKWLESAVAWFAKFIGAADDADGSVSAWRNTLVFTAKILAIITAAMVTNTAWQKLVVLWTNRNTQATTLYNIATKARAVAEAAGILFTQGWAAAQMLLSGNITGATQALKVMNTVIKTSPWGFLLSAIAAIVVAYQAFKEEAEQIDAIQKNMNEIHEEASKNISKQKNEIELLAKVARDEARSQEERQKAIARLNEIIPDHIGILNLQNIKTMEGKAIIDQYTESLYKNARARAAQAKFDELAKQKLELENKKAVDFQGGVSKFMSDITGQSGSQLDSMKTKEELSAYIIKNFKDYVEARQGKDGKTYVNTKKFNEIFNNLSRAGLSKKFEEIDNIDAQMKALESELLSADNIDKLLNGGINANPDAVPDDGKGKGKKDKKKEYDDSYLEDERRRKEELYQINKKAEEDRIALLKDGYNKELRLEILRQQDVLHQAEVKAEQLKLLEEKLRKDLADAEKNGDTKKVSSIKNQLEYIKQEKEKANEQQIYLEKLHHLKIATIQEKAGKDEIEKLHEQYQQEKLVRETAFLEELNALSLSEKEKAKRKEEFQKQETQREIEYLQKQAEKLSTILSGISIDGVEFNLLSEEEIDQFNKDLLKVKNAIAKLKEAKPGTETKEIDLGLGGDVDILGFSQAQWDNFFKNIEQGTIGVQTMKFAVGALSNIWSQFSQLQAAGESQRLRNYENSSNNEKRILKRKLDAGFINQDQYNKKIEQIEKDLDIKKADIEYKQAKRQKSQAIVKTIIDTATSIMQLWTNPGFPMAIPLSIMVGAMGALQVATIARQPLPARGAEEGYYPNLIKREQDGRLFRTTGTSKVKTGLYSKPRLLVGEGPGDMPEMVIDKKAFAQIAPETKAALFRDISIAKGYEKGLYPPMIKNNSSSNSLVNDQELIKELLTMIAKNTEAIEDLKNNPIIAYLSSDYKTLKELDRLQKEYKEFKSKQKMTS